MAYEIQLDLFGSETADFDRVYSEVMEAVKDRCEHVKRDFSDAWIVGSHGELVECHDKMYCCPEPLLRLGYRYGLKDYDRFDVSGITTSELEAVKARVMARLELNKPKLVVYSVEDGDLLASGGKPYRTRAGIDRHLERNGFINRYRVIQIDDSEKGVGWAARLIKEFD